MDIDVVLGHQAISFKSFVLFHTTFFNNYRLIKHVDIDSIDVKLLLHLFFFLILSFVLVWSLKLLRVRAIVDVLSVPAATHALAAMLRDDEVSDSLSLSLSGQVLYLFLFVDTAIANQLPAAFLE